MVKRIALYVTCLFAGLLPACATAEAFGPVEALRSAKVFASFSGAMRSSLIAMLDAIDIPSVYGRSSSREFFEEPGLAHFTSALRYPVYLNNKNYSGNPSLLKTPELRRMIDGYLMEEARVLPHAVWVPLGRHAEEALKHLVLKCALKDQQVLTGLPHPSGANAERIAYFLGRKDRAALSSKTNALKIDQAKSALLAKVRRLKAAREVV